MSYNIRRIDPFWKASPVVLAVAIVGAVIAMLGYAKGNMLIAGIGALVMAAGVLMAAKPALSAVLGCLGVFGGLVTFVLMPNIQTADMSIPMKLLSTALFAVLYMVLMDALVLVIAALYNFFSGSFGGISVEFDGAGQAEGE